MKQVNDLRGSTTAISTAGAKSLSLAKRLCAWVRSRGEGQSLVEFALVLPLMLLILTGIFMMGIIMLNYQSLLAAVNQGGMALQILPATPGADPCSTVATAMTYASPGLVASNVQLTVTIGSQTPSTTQPISTATCSGLASYAQPNVLGTVTATYPCNLSSYGFKFASNCQLTATTQELMQ